ncbi:protein of unknown function (plasmid) [Cupriavidus neocaledonicus]|uniref:Uncharacterized protein n=1 Tax=Cupriavidus neocaledonicus TaxID=1040979 RepID=A0A375HS28_9BURK|nr:hypothetical protein CBM2605_B60003 [Cupriavidus neocaledonicus]SPD60702.1 protein of unknown function [Cupriavidus neocaledonicus]
MHCVSACAGGSTHPREARNDRRHASAENLQRLVWQGAPAFQMPRPDAARAGQRGKADVGANGPGPRKILVQPAASQARENGRKKYVSELKRMATQLEEGGLLLRRIQKYLTDTRLTQQI